MNKPMNKPQTKKKVYITTVSEAQKNLSEIVNSGDTVMIRKYRDIMAVLLPLSEYSRLTGASQIGDQ